MSKNREELLRNMSNSQASYEITNVLQSIEDLKKELVKKEKEYDILYDKLNN